MTEGIVIIALCPSWHPDLRQSWEVPVGCSLEAGHAGQHEGRWIRESDMEVVSWA